MKGQGLLPVRIEGIRSPVMESDKTLRMCDTERDAFLTSVTLSGLTYQAIADRIGVTKQAVNKWSRNGVPHDRVRAFCNATGSLLLTQYIKVEQAKAAVYGHMRETDRIEQIACQARAA
jgi:hypothetical protein